MEKSIGQIWVKLERNFCKNNLWQRQVTELKNNWKGINIYTRSSFYYSETGKDDNWRVIFFNEVQ